MLGYNNITWETEQEDICSTMQMIWGGGWCALYFSRHVALAFLLL